MYPLILKIRKKIAQKITAFSSDPRPSSYPYISGDTLRSACDHRHEKGNRCLPEKVSFGQSVFVEGDFLEDFFTVIHPHIKDAYVLVSHNGDLNITADFLKYIDDKILAWYAQNVDVQHPKLIPLPIGIENAYYRNNGQVIGFEKVRKMHIPKIPRILSALNIITNKKERVPALDYLRTHPAVDVLTTSHQSFVTRESKLASYMFTASPPGNGIDCMRTWEAMYVGSVPIVKKSICMSYFKNLGLPLYVIDDWRELDILDSTQLAAVYERLAKDFNHPALWVDYWIKKITSHRTHEQR